MPDVIAPDLRVLFCGINPGLYTAVTGDHFAGPGNRFWPALHQSGFTGRQLHPSEKNLLLDYGCGITNVVGRATGRADELARAELEEGGIRLREKVETYRPHTLAVLGLGAYRAAFGVPDAVVGLQPERIGATHLWLLPNPSGLNAHYLLQDHVRLYTALRQWVDG